MSSLESFVLISRKVEVACYKLSKNKKRRKLIETHWTQICILLNRQLPLWFTEDIHWMWSEKYLFSPWKSFLLLFYSRTSPCYIYIFVFIYVVAAFSYHFISAHLDSPTDELMWKCASISKVPPQEGRKCPKTHKSNEFLQFIRFCTAFIPEIQWFFFKDSVIVIV